MTAYEDRRERRIERFEGRAARARGRSDDAWNAANRATAGIPFGQPILVGHHSEKRHRAAIDKGARAMDCMVAESKKASHYAGRAIGAEQRNAIDSDDPEAVVKMREKIAELEAAQEREKALNVAWRKAGKPGAADIEGWRKWADAVGVSHAIGDAAANRPAYEQGAPAPAYSLSNRNANIKRCRDRLAELERLPTEGDKETETKYGRVTVRMDPDEGRVFVETPGRNTEATKILRGRGWCWSRYHGCWARKLTANAIATAKHEIGPELEKVYGGAA